MFLDILSEFLSRCPVFRGRKIFQNFLAPDGHSISIQAVAADPVARRYTDGGAVYQTVFKLVFREPFDGCNDFSSLFAALSSWVESVNFPDTLPALPDGFSPVSLSILKSGAISSSSSSSSKFETVCRFTYSK